MNAYHNSREMKFRTPFGAVKAGTELTLDIDLWDGIPTEVILRIWADNAGEMRMPMELRQREGGYTASVVFSPQTSGLYWYRFELRDAEGVFNYYGAQEGRQGGIGKMYPADSDCPSYQITVYKDYKLPSWYKNAIVYQIFPDRFARELKKNESKGRDAEAAIPAKTKDITMSVHGDEKAENLTKWAYGDDKAENLTKSAYGDDKAGDTTSAAKIHNQAEDIYEDDATLTARLTGHANGPKRRIVSWDKPVSYERNPDRSIAAWDFYGGSLRGIMQKLNYLKELGISAIYLNPIFEAASSHRYDTGDYMYIDPLLGSEEDFKELCQKAEELDISIILDGVFNHTGSDSIYFNKNGNYDSEGAFNNEKSPYRSWYNFNNETKDGYESWWGVSDLPSLKKSEQGLRAFIYGDGISVVRKWLRLGAKGWRLDVADELPDDYIEGIKKAMKEELGEESILIGEVWEDASNKISYGVRRRYLQGDELDSVMNYPFCDGAGDFLTGKVSAEELTESMYALMENYPKEVFYGGLNLLGSHDRARILTVLGDAPEAECLSEEERASYRLSDSERGKAKARLWLGVLMQMTMPGVPCIYYGDEAGLEGYGDPYNRATYPWGSADADCMSIYRNAIGIRHSHRIFTEGDFEPFALDEDVYGFTRRLGSEAVTVLINRSQSSEKEALIPCLGEYASDIISGKLYSNCFKRRIKTEDSHVRYSYVNASDKAAATGLAENYAGENCAADLTVSEQKKVSSDKLLVHLNRLGSAVIYFAPEKRLGEALDAGTGVLCHISSLPHQKNSSAAKSLGVIGDECFRFIDYLKARGDRYWQILPLNPTDSEGSPYAGSSAFAGNPELLPYSEEELHKRYARFSCDRQSKSNSMHTDGLCNERYKADKEAVYEHDGKNNDAVSGKENADIHVNSYEDDTEEEDKGLSYEQFAADNAEWLDGYAMYQAIKQRMGNKPYSEWDEEYRSLSADLLNDKGLSQEADYYRFEQYVFELEWCKVRAYAEKQGISIIGDMPIYVSADSADVWEHPEFFNTDEEAGVPPDYFSENGQNWGNPLYRWEVLKEDGFSWWMRRFKRAFKLYDAVRLDHFKGFEAYWAIPRGEKAIKGHWMQGPGRELFEEAYRQFGPLPIIAEDLGYLTPGVRMLMANTGFPGMDVMQFSNNDPLIDYSPACDRVSYTGTHDNETLLGWCKSHYKEEIDRLLSERNITPEDKNLAVPEDKKLALMSKNCAAQRDTGYDELFDAEARSLADSLIKRFFDTDALIKIVPLQDILGLDNDARMNTPGTVGTNWRWQAT